MGNNIETFWSELLKGSCAIDTIKAFDTENLAVKVAAEVKDFNPESFGIEKTMIRHNDRYALYALAAAIQAMQDSGLTVEKDVDPSRFGCAIGSGIGGIQTFCKEHTSLMNDGPRRVSPLFIPEMIAANFE